jgi:hypothetical protein
MTMATRAEQFRSEQERHKRRPARTDTREPTPGGHAEKKATYAREQQSTEARPSRKSTRGGKNRAKADAPLVISQEREQNTPETRFRASAARRQTVRGNP